MPQQIWFIHGGDTFDTYEEYLKSLKNFTVSLEDLNQKGWKSTLGEKLGADYEVLAPRMPNGYNAKYIEWKIWFEKWLPFVTDNAMFIGHSLGGIFLAKYFAEETMEKSIRATFLIAAPHHATNAESLADFILPAEALAKEGPLKKFAAQSKQIFLYHSHDDPVVPFTDVERYQKDLPQAHLKTFTDRQHFNQPEFSELVDDIHGLAASSVPPHGANSHFGPTRPTNDPSGHSIASCVQKTASPLGPGIGFEETLG